MAGLSLVLSVVGVFGVIAYAVTQRTREFGIRIALGAGRGSVMRDVLLHGMGLIGVEVAVGTGGAVAGTRVLEGFLFGIEPLDPAVFGAAVLTVVGTGFLACYLPARRATRVDPVQALRFE